MTPGDHLNDTEPSAWQGDKKPDPGPDDHRLGQAARRFAAAAVAVEGHLGARAGAEYEAKLTEWKVAYRELRLAASAFKGS